MKSLPLREKLFYLFTTIIFLYSAMAGIVFDKKSIMSVVITGSYFGYGVYFVAKYSKIQNFMKPMFFFVFYLFFLILFSSDILYSLKNLIKSTIPFLFFSISYTIVTDIFKFRKLNNAMVILIILFVFNVIIANLFSLGGMSYKDEDTIDVGNIYSNGLNSMAYILAALPLILKINFENKPTQRIIVLLFAVAALIIMIVLLKRASLLALVGGYGIYFLFQRKKSGMIKYILIMGIALFLTFPLYSDLLRGRLEARESRLQIDSYETEGRYVEWSMVLEEMDVFNKPIRTIFGREMFNSPGNYGFGRAGGRQIHNDYMRVLNGAGFFGLGLFLFFNYQILMAFLRLRKVIMEKSMMDKLLFNLLNSLFISFFLMYFIIAFSGGIDGLLFTSIRFIYLGAILGIFQRSINTYGLKQKEQFSKEILKA